MIKVKLTQPAVILDKYYRAGTWVSVPTEQAVTQGYKAANKQVLRRKIAATAGDSESLLGTVSDASAYAIDSMVMDILAVERSESSSYKAARVDLHNQFYGDGSWSKTVAFSQNWFDKRQSKAIVLPIDLKGVESVFADIVMRGNGVAQVLKQVLPNDH